MDRTAFSRIEKSFIGHFDLQKFPPGTKPARIQKRAPAASQRTPLPCQKPVQQIGVARLACTPKTEVQPARDAA